LLIKLIKGGQLVMNL